MQATIGDQQSSIRDLTGLIHPESSRERMSALLVAHLDESGIHAGSRICAIAGFVGAQEEWGVFERRWRREIEQAGVRQFHMAEFESRQGEFVGWSEGRREQFLERLMELIRARDLEGVGSGLVMADYDRLSDDEKAWMTHGNPEQPYFLCFQHCVVEAVSRANALPSAERVAFVFDRQDDFQAEATRLYNRMKDQVDWPNRFRLADFVSFASKRETVALQAADLLAYETYKHLENRLYSPERGTRWPMRQLEQRVRDMRYFDALGFRNLLELRPQ